METSFEWKTIKDYQDIKFEIFEGIAKITINRPEVYNAFRPETNMEMIEAMDIAMSAVVMESIGADIRGANSKLFGHISLDISGSLRDFIRQASSS